MSSPQVPPQVPPQAPPQAPPQVPPQVPPQAPPQAPAPALAPALSQPAQGLPQGVQTGNVEPFDLPLELKTIIIVLPFSLIAYCVGYFFGVDCASYMSKSEFIDTLKTMFKNNETSLAITTAIERYLDSTVCYELPKVWAIINFFAITLTSQIVSLLMYVFQLSVLPFYVTSYWVCVSAILFAFPLATYWFPKYFWVAILGQFVTIIITIVVRIMKPIFVVWIYFNLLVIFVIKKVWQCCCGCHDFCNCHDPAKLAAYLEIEFKHM